MKSKPLDLTYIALFAALIALCSWITIPAAVPFTLQTFAIFATLGILGGRRGTMAIAVYLLMAAIGLPVLSGFSGGLGAMLGVTGGYLLGFFVMGITYWLLTSLWGAGPKAMLTALALCLVVCYLFGTLWFMLVYLRTTGPVGVSAVLGWCVFPFLIPDLMKLGLALLLTRRVGRFVRA